MIGNADQKWLAVGRRRRGGGPDIHSQVRTELPWLQWWGCRPDTMAGQGLDSRPRSSKTDLCHGTARVHPSASFSSHIYTTYTRLLPYYLTLPTYYVSPHRFTSNAPPSKIPLTHCRSTHPSSRAAERDLYAKTLPVSPAPKPQSPKAEAQAQSSSSISMFPTHPSPYGFDFVCVFFFFLFSFLSRHYSSRWPGCLAYAAPMLLLRGGQDTRI